VPVFDLIQAIASAATTVGVLFAGWQLRQSRVQAVTTFEDQLAGQYRDIAHRLPIEALLGEPLDDAAHTAALGAMYHYFDLSNEQAYLYSKRRVRRATWEEWRDGIEQNLRRPAFARAWAEVSARAPESFNDLREALVGRLPVSGGALDRRTTVGAAVIPT
jgi:hypothetical protein